LKKVLITVLILLISVFASSFSNASNISDLILLPTADLIHENGVISAEFTPEPGIEGIFALQSNLNIGGEINLSEGENSELGFKVKALFFEEKEKYPAIAAGIENNDLYLVASKNLGQGLRAHMGIGNGHLEGLFIGVNKVLNPVRLESSNDGKAFPLPLTILMAEYLDSNINIGARLKVKEAIYLDLALLDFNEFKTALSFSF